MEPHAVGGGASEPSDSFGESSDRSVAGPASKASDGRKAYVRVEGHVPRRHAPRRSLTAWTIPSTPKDTERRALTVLFVTIPRPNSGRGIYRTARPHNMARVYKTVRVCETSLESKEGSSHTNWFVDEARTCRLQK
jgi:hypothetical protein